MSFLTERVFRLATPLSRAVAVQAPRTFATSAALRKSPTESVKDGLKKVDRVVSENVLPGLDAAAKVKDAAENISASEAKGKAQGKAEELSGQAKGAAHEAAGKVKGAAAEAKGKL